jgi:hypothetical protein
MTVAAPARPAVATPITPEQRAAAFNAATRQKFVMVPVPEAFAVGSIHRIILPKVGLLARVFLHFNGTLTVTVGGGSSTAAPRSPWNIANRIRLLANSTLPIIDVSGFGLYVANLLTDWAGVQSRPGTFATAFTATNVPQYEPPAIAEVARFAVANGANTVDISYELPVKLTEQDPVGLIIAQNPQTQLTLEITDGQIADLTTLAGGATATLTGTWQVGMEYFEAPAAPDAMPDMSFVHVWQEQRVPVSATGQQAIQLLVGDTYLRIAHIVQLNAVLNRADIERIALVLNQADTPYTVDRWLALYRQRRIYGKDLGDGLFIHDFFVPETQRDMINSALYSDLRTRVDVAAGAVLGTGTNFIDTVVEKLVQVA